MVKCPDCKGEGILRGFGCPGFRPISIPCQMCAGTKEVSEERLEWMKVGDAMREDRINRGVTCRVEAQERGIKAVELSEMERGIRKPIPRSAKV